MARTGLGRELQEIEDVERECTLDAGEGADDVVIEQDHVAKRGGCPRNEIALGDDDESAKERGAIRAVRRRHPVGTRHEEG